MTHETNDLAVFSMAQRHLTHDEKKAAEAAFRGLPPNPDWSSAARSVYDGIVKAMPDVEAPLVGDSGPTTEDEGPASLPVRPEGRAYVPQWRGAGGKEPPPDLPGGIEAEQDVHQLHAGSREQAIEAGVLVDITLQAQEIGLPLPVGVSRALWDYGITASDRVPDAEQDQRVRDLLMALRLHLSRSPLVSPVTQFPALFTFPPDPLPQVCGVCALVQAESADHPFLTLVLPTELSTSPSS